MSRLLDEEGNVHEPGLFGGWHRKQGLFGTERDVDFFGRPNIRRDFLGRPVQARSGFGSPISSDDDGRPLYEPIDTPSSGGFSPSAGDALAGLLALGLVILLVAAIAALFTGIVKLIEAVFKGYQHLVRRYPTPLLIFHLAIGMFIVYYLLALAGFPLSIQLGGALLVPLIWGWYRLTRNWPHIFMPINCIALGAALWFFVERYRINWEVGWSRLTSGLPLLGNLPLILAVLPLLIWFWSQGARRFPRVFFFLGRVIAGMLLWFSLMRVWTTWQPYWQTFVSPLPFLSTLTGWLILLLPLGLWFWQKGQARLPLVFTGLNLLLFGGLLGLAAHHTRSAWIGAWQHWMEGLPFLSAPILTISLAPAAFWVWGVAVNTWRRWLAIPNALLTGGLLWLILDRTRSAWQIPWDIFWDSVPLMVDPALVLLFFPLSLWLWKKGATRWPEHWGIARAILWGGILWWLVERTRLYWSATWEQFAGTDQLNLATIIALSIPAAWIWKRLSWRWARLFRVLGWILVTFLLYWLLGRSFPFSVHFLRAAAASIPLAVYAWLTLLVRRPLIALGIVFIPLAGIGLLYYFAPDLYLNLLSELIIWISPQMVPFWKIP